MFTQYIKRILDAKVYDVAEETPVDAMPFLRKQLGNQVLTKREDLQPVFSFKIRGAYNKIAKLSTSERDKGVVAASAGNHAQGVALAAGRLGIQATIVMPRTTPSIKVASVKEFGANVVLYGDNFDEAYQHSVMLKEKFGYIFVHPYDDTDVIAGQGTIGMEIIRQCREPLQAVFVPVGGGGLIAGIAAYIKYLRPDIKVIGVESDESACLKIALKDGKRSVLPKVGIFADGVAVRQIGKEPFRIAKECVDDVITVNTDEICAAIKDIYTDLRSIAEPAGALSIAGLKKYIEETGVKDQTFLAVISGANVNFDRLRHISERTEIGEKREVLLAVTIPERPGAFKNFCEALSGHNITEFNYRFADPDHAVVLAGIQIECAAQRQEIIANLDSQGYPVIDLSDNELTKLHIRYMVGGGSRDLGNEKVFRFQFPERPGALLEFFNTIGCQWNISLFHYRNHGTDFGRVFIGLQVDNKDTKKLMDFLKKLKYNYVLESDNPAYKAFL